MNDETDFTMAPPWWRISSSSGRHHGDMDDGDYDDTDDDDDDTDDDNEGLHYAEQVYIMCPWYGVPTGGHTHTPVKYSSPWRVRLRASVARGLSGDWRASGRPGLLLRSGFARAI